ncbi:MAG TPA: PQQ-binding-like beta-propeller repeat protein [Deltaproteobacteria bacterium]|nr:PQQ-binding-like beta-propeller repeat protein [Deltaproteobacteria bacterium]HPR54431.1 PQQ-binding-like beta-propeller repeat protein [Deltaproteobacteria bacterium]
MWTGSSHRIVLFLVALLAILSIQCNGYEKTIDSKGKDAKERDTMFKLDGVEYPVEYANYQRNSHVRVAVRATGRERWAKAYREADEDVFPAPRTVLVKGDVLGVLSVDNLLVYKSDGSFQYMVPLGNNTPVVFGREAFAYIIPAYLLNYQEYIGKPILEQGEFPTLGEWAYVLLFKPGNDDFMAVVQFTGGPKPRELPQRFDLYRKQIEKSLVRWRYSGEGSIDHAMLTTGGRMFVVVQGRKVNLVETVDMKVVSGFDLEYDEVESASLDTKDNLVIIGRGAKNKGERPWLTKLSLKGSVLWEYELRNPQTHQPPACGGAEKVYVPDSNRLLCIDNGRLGWDQPMKGAGKAWLTVAQGDEVVSVQDRQLSLFDSAGSVKFSVQMTQEEEGFNATPALDAQGRIYVAGNRRLYCFE